MKNLLKATILANDNATDRVAIFCRRDGETYSWFLADGTSCETSSPLSQGLAGAKRAAYASWSIGRPWYLEANW